MKTIIKLPVLLTLLLAFFFSCQKEVSFELGTSKISVGSLQVDGSGGCTGAVVSGTFIKDSILNSTHFATVNVNVDTAGSYIIRTDTIQGYYFNAVGNFTSTGSQSVKLKGYGKPLSAGTHIFTLTYNGTVCEFSVIVGFTSTGDYFPRTVNSNWSYENNGDPNDSLLVVVIPQTLTVSGNAFNIFIWTDNAANGFDTSGYYRRSGSDYFEWIDAGSAVGLDNPVWIELNFLKDNLSAGGTWNSNSFSGSLTSGGVTTNYTLRFTYSILQQNTAVTVNGISYANTIVVKQELQGQVSGNWTTITDAGYLQNYYARDKGLIKQDFYSAGTIINAMNVRRMVVY